MTLLLCLASAALAAAQPHPLTGVYERELDGRRLVLEVHVAPDGTLTGLARRGRSSPGYYFEGAYAGGSATGFFHDPTTILAVSFVLEAHHDVIGWYTYAGSVGDPPEPPPEIGYYLRQPGPGPAGPIPAPLSVLLRYGRNEAVLAAGAGGAELQLRDARHVLEVALLAMRQAGLAGALFPGRIYEEWIGYVTSAFKRAAPETQALLADSEGWWPELAEAWEGATPAARRRVSQDVLLMIFTAETVAAWLQQADEGFRGETGATCGTLMTCVLRTLDRTALEAARQRLPCLSVTRCGAPGAPAHP